MKDLTELINQRRSIRTFTGEALTEDQLRKIITCGMHAPSAYNKQPWVFLSITSQKKMRQLSPLCSWWKMLENAGGVIITCMDKRLLGDTPLEFFVASCNAAAENMLLAANAMGLGGVWLGICEESEYYMEFCKAINLPGYLRVTSMIAVGKTGEKKKFIERFNPEKWIRESF